MSKLTKQQALEIYGIDIDNVTKRDDLVPFSKSKRRKADDCALMLFDEIVLAKTDDDPNDTPGPLLEKLSQFVSAMVIADPSKSEQEHLFTLLHTAHGRKLAEHLNSISKKEHPMPQLNMQLISAVENGLMAQAKLQKRDGESEAKTFSRVYENDIEYRKQWAALTDAKHLLAYTKSLATLTPTSTVVGSSLVADDSAEAVRQLSEMAEKQHRTFEDVFNDPNNRELAGKTYTAAHRPNLSSTSGSELQR